ncbi:MAG: class A beta-lactamase [Acidobacteria bacterium]|nr:class A beta-lactamase [Acidobacteriota bacterium]
MRTRTLLKSLFALLVLIAPAAAQPGPPSRVGSEIERLAHAIDGKVGVAAIHLESGRRVSLNGSEAFPMASTFKVPVAVQFFKRIEKGEIRLDQMITLAPSDLHPGSGEITHLLDDPGVSLSLHNLLELMLLISDNSATDLVLKASGGPVQVTTRMRELGVEGIRVDRPTIVLIADWLGVQLPPESEWSPQRFRELAQKVTPETRRAAEEAFSKDPRDTSTPDGMVLLLQKIWKGEALNEASTKQLLDIMVRCETGPLRLKGMLPPETLLMHKTGTIGGSANDVGIITLPDNAGHVAIAVFVKDSKKPTEDRERVIAHIARAVYDYFLFSDK